MGTNQTVIENHVLILACSLLKFDPVLMLLVLWS
jgi:hypothetical protein